MIVHANGCRWRGAAAAIAFLAVVAVPASGDDLRMRLLGTTGVASQPFAQDCVARCDAASDRCMAEAQGDAAKERDRDRAYDECLRKCD